MTAVVALASGAIGFLGSHLLGVPRAWPAVIAAGSLLFAGLTAECSWPETTQSRAGSTMRTRPVTLLASWLGRVWTGLALHDCDDVLDGPTQDEPSHG